MFFNLSHSDVKIFTSGESLEEFVLLEVRGATAPLLLAPAEGLGPSGPTRGPLGPAVGLRPPALELKLIYILLLS